MNGGDFVVPTVPGCSWPPFAKPSRPSMASVTIAIACCRGHSSTWRGSHAQPTTLPDRPIVATWASKALQSRSRELSPSLSARSRITADGISSSTAISALASEVTVTTRAPALEKAFAISKAMRGSSSQMRIEQHFAGSRLRAIKPVEPWPPSAPPLDYGSSGGQPSWRYSWLSRAARQSAKLPEPGAATCNGPRGVPSRRSILKDATKRDAD